MIPIEEPVDPVEALALAAYLERKAHFSWTKEEQEERRLRWMIESITGVQLLELQFSRQQVPVGLHPPGRIEERLVAESQRWRFYCIHDDCLLITRFCEDCRFPLAQRYFWTHQDRPELGSWLLTLRQGCPGYRCSKCGEQETEEK